MPKRKSLTSPIRARMRRSLFDHHWDSLEEWVKTLNELADLDDEDIEQLIGRPANDTDDDPDA